MVLTRDSLVWFVTLGAAVVAYLLASDKPPTDWSYREWLQAAAAAFAAISTKLQASPLQLSFKGKARMERGEAHRDIPAPADSSSDTPRPPDDDPPSRLGSDPYAGGLS